MEKLTIKDFTKKYSDQFDLQKWVKLSYLFSSVSGRYIKKILPLFNIVILKQDEILFNQGELSDNLYILVSGTLVACKISEKKSMIVGQIYPGETIGELGIFNKRSRTLTIQTISTAILLELSHENFLYIWGKYVPTETHMKMIDSIINRSQNIIKILSKDSVNNHTALITNKNDDLTEFFQHLKSLESEQNFLIIDDQYFKSHNIQIDQETIENILHYSIQKDITLIFVITDNQLFGLLENEANPIRYILANVNGLFVLNKDKKNLLEYTHFFEKDHYPLLKDRGIIFLYKSTETPDATIRGIDFKSCHFRYHIRMDRPQDLKRLARYLCRNAHGVVCSGGGSKSWATLGVIQALQEANFPIDAIGGTSSGSLVSSVYALTQNFEDTYEILKLLFPVGYNDVSWKNYSFPLVSITNGKLLTQTLKDIFQQLYTEDLWLPNFSISCNLNTREEVVQNSGLVSENLRASCSLPLIYPPVTKNGQLYLDGGLLNNFPINHMRELLGKRGFIVGINLSPIRPDPTYYSVPPVVPFSMGLLARLKLAHSDIKHPPLLSTFINALLLGSTPRVSKNILDTNLLIEPDLDQYPMLGIPPHKINELIEIGYKTCCERLNQQKPRD